jgi:hypothetical protein
VANDLIAHKLDKARALLAECRDAGQAKQVADMARAAEVYARRQRLSEEAIGYAHTVKVDALALMGEFLKANPPRGAGPGRGHKGKKKTNAAGELVSGLPPEIPPKESSAAQDLADLKAEDPEAFEQVRAGEITVKAGVTRVRKRKREERKKKEAAAKHKESNPSPVSDLFRIDCGDCLTWMASLPEDSVDLVFGSPPYEMARLYLEGGEDMGIARTTEQWVAWMASVYKAALRVCTGLVAFVIEGQTKDYRWTASPALLMADLHRAGVNLRKPPVYHRVGIPGSGGPDWLRNDYEFIICATRKGQMPWSDNTVMGHAPKYQPGGLPSHRTQDGSRVNGESGYASMTDRGNVGPHRARRQAGRPYNPPERANPGNVVFCGAVGGGNMGDELCHENEAPFPEHLAEFFVRSFCRPGGTVCDPFCGSGTTGKAAVQHGRKFLGCDIRESQVNLTKRRLREVQQVLPLEC